MDYLRFAEVYEKLAATTKKLEKTEILAVFLRELREEGKSEWIYLVQGRVVPTYDSREFGISRQLAIQAIVKAFGVSEAKVMQQLRTIGDLGEIARQCAEQRKQAALFSKKLKVEHVFLTLHNVLDIEGKGAVEKKLGLVCELLTAAKPMEAQYLIRTLLQDLRVGVADALLRDAIAQALFPEDASAVQKIGAAYDLVNDSAAVFETAGKGLAALEHMGLMPGMPLNVMLPVKISSVEEGFESCGKPAAFEHKYDGFRVVIHKDAHGITLFTRRQENVTRQFPDVVKAVQEHIKGASFILDSEVVGYEPKTNKYQPFEAISQRIRRKYDVAALQKQLPVEVNVFDVLYYNGESVMARPFRERRMLVERIIRPQPYVLRAAAQFVTADVKKAEQFYHDALKLGEEGVIVKNLEAAYQPGRRVGFMAKLKPVIADLDLVILGAEHGTGKRGGWLTSYIVACRDKQGNYQSVGKVSSGLKEKEEEGTSYELMTKLLQPLIIKKEGASVEVKPKIVVAVTYQNIQKSPAYSSGYALRFPRISAYRPDKPAEEIATLKEIEREVRRQRAPLRKER